MTQRAHARGPAEPPAAAEDYWAACERRAMRFVERHYRWPGVCALHRPALGFDLLKAPANVLLAVPALAVQIAGLALRRLGAVRAARRLLGLPLGFRTGVEKALAARLRREVLAIEPASRGEWETLLGRAERAVANDLIVRYAETRRAAADLSTALLVGIVGAFLVGQFTPGSISAGHELAASVARHAAVQDFFLGPLLGGWFYHLFPPEAGLLAEVLAMVAVASLMALVSAFSGLFADPLQARLGLHQVRLRRWLGALRRLSGDAAEEDYRPWDPYMARIVDVVDALKGFGTL